MLGGVLSDIAGVLGGVLNDITGVLGYCAGVLDFDIFVSLAAGFFHLKEMKAMQNFF